MRQTTEQQEVNEILTYARAIADGLNWDAEFRNSEQCVIDYVALGVRVNASYQNLSNGTFTKEKLFDFLIKVGQISTQYKRCWSNTERAIVDGLTWGD